MSDETYGKPVDNEHLLLLKHDIKNQLSNIQLAVEGLRFELDDVNEDITLYIESLSISAKKIDDLLNNIQTDI
jgi:peptidoglycan hydrolase CwlO-like protein